MALGPLGDLQPIAIVAAVMIIITAVGAMMRESALDMLTDDSYEENLTKNSSVGLQNLVNQSDSLFSVVVPILMLGLVFYFLNKNSG